jgi:hypothetical protein
MKVTLTEVMRDALEAALLEGVRSPRRPYGKATLNRIRKAARNGKRACGLSSEGLRYFP